MRIIVNLIVYAIAVVITAYLLKAGVTIDSFTTALVVAVVLGIINTFIKPIINLLTLPFNIITLGLFSFVINGILILLVSNFVKGFHVSGFLWAILFSLVLSIVSAVLNKLTGSD